MGNCIASPPPPPKLEVSKPKLVSKQKQGAKELKVNYCINDKTAILGQGAFGKVI